MKNIIYTFIIIFCMGFFIGCIDEEDPYIEEEIYYNVSFIGFADVLLSEVKVLKGSSISTPTPPSIEGYEFIGWTEEVLKVESDLVIQAIYQKKQYKVTFVSFDEVVESQIVSYKESATPPTLAIKYGYEFIGWDKDYNNMKEDLVINAIWEKIYSSSYVEVFDFEEMYDYSSLLDDIVQEVNLKYTYSTIKHGGTRGTNELIYYNETNKVNTNIYGFEVAIDKFNIVVQKATKVDIPDGGYVLSAHGTSIALLDDNLKIGDTLVYVGSGVAKVYRNSQTSSIIGLGVELTRLKSEIINADESYLVLDYKQIISTYNETINKYNDLTINYDSSIIEEALQSALNINFMLVEPSSIRVNATWHYPLRAKLYPENNQVEVERFLDKLNSMGINRVYLNTNFDGKSIYKSLYLSTSLTNNNKYGEYKDYLECFIDQAHKRNIEVFAWTNTLIAGDGKNNSFYSDKGWLLKGINGEDNHGKMYYLDISNDEVQEFLENVFSELASYDLDGIEYDFIRYPSGNLYTYNSVISDTSNVKDWGYTNTFITKFMNEYDLTGDFLELIKSNKTIRDNWLIFKTNFLTKTVEMLNTTIRSVNSDIHISAAVMPSITTARNVYLQDWKTWIELGYVDILEPMIYTADNNYLATAITNMKTVVGSNIDIVVGIFPEGSGSESYQNASQIRIISEIDVAGVSKFSSRTIFSSRLKDAYFYMNRDYITTPSIDKEDIFTNYLRSLTDKIDNYYLLKDFEEVYDLYLHTILFSELEMDNDEVMEFIKTEIINNIKNETIKERLEKEHNRISRYLN